jgi:formylglycine-generating enzyme required for sulfatase activity
MKMAPNYLQRTGYRLPTEAEWEYACRAKSLTSRYYGETEELLEKYAWYSKNSLTRWMIPVGSLKPNDWGLFDMLGNGQEWTQDLGGYDVLGGGLTEDREPTELAIDPSAIRTLRGASFSHITKLVRSASRIGYGPSVYTDAFGFRVARTFRY